jgi:hypothetical protein
MSFLMSPSHLFFGLPNCLVNIGFHLYTSCVNSYRSYSGSVTHKPVNVTWYTLHTKLNFTTGDSFGWPMMLQCINYSHWRWPFQVWNVLELHIVLIKGWFNNMWVYLSVFIEYSDTSAWIWTRWKVIWTLSTFFNFISIIMNFTCTSPS